MEVPEYIKQERGMIRCGSNEAFLHYRMENRVMGGRGGEGSERVVVRSPLSRRLTGIPGRATVVD